LNPKKLKIVHGNGYCSDGCAITHLTKERNDIDKILGELEWN